MEKLQKTRMVVHPFPPVVSKDCKILILGSVPSVKSVQNNFYYMNKYNRFWNVLGKIIDENLVKMKAEEKTNALLKHKIALYDAIFSCEIEGSSDSKIKVIEYADLAGIIANTQIERIFANGDKAFQAVKKGNGTYFAMTEKLPSTSPANASFSEQRLVENWKVIEKYL